VWCCLYDPTFCHFSRTPACDRQTDTDRRRPMAKKSDTYFVGSNISVEHRFCQDKTLLSCFVTLRLQGREKLVYRLIIMFLSTEIFSKRRKIYSWFEEKPECRYQPGNDGHTIRIYYKTVSSVVNSHADKNRLRNLLYDS